MGSVTQALARITGRSCFETYRRCLDKERLSLLEYDYCDQEFMAQQGETIRYEGTRNIASIAADWAGRDPAFKLFLDGSRRTYKIVDMTIGSQVFPIVAGQVGVGVCKREARRVAPCELMFDIVLAVPDKINPDGGGSRQNAAIQRERMSFTVCGPSLGILRTPPAISPNGWMNLDNCLS